MKRVFLWGVLVLFSMLGLSAESNSSITVESNSTSSVENNATENNTTEINKEEEALKKQMEREKKYAREQVFYKGSEYDLSSFEVDKSSLDNIPLIEPDYDFDMDDVYD